MVASEGGQLDAQAVRVHVEALVVGLRELHDEVVGYQGPAVRNDCGTVIHLALHRTRDLDRLKLGLERARKGTLDHAL
jgi:hypothetical protein